ncbi:hypothetical protein D8B26_001406 [Coccidioides posadasii str. Silveira]|uniref:F-box domain-containing protein n=3 Tax=Coccidioides posadasii TaxID=199306 RepID=E9DAH5_COCPS|nr:hypothetical protein CPC735_046830 [Coccidioides posadasii C735 delta SOWgp]EER23313.1 hypothetical protein CPC735_046830 [Coccidioides posadasii C735 delta SOWgp]EFW16597.1 hypothetical protein CPSG_06556 [Coccidioides posadasii str. Silveira]KMM64640.1 F-box domain-containing protein [Coccidioides posadasii RMSCC 3488]QVM06700.1 hypothetical protein D8B26_001406 [Coccidioides posadasii str. Silveira]|eukprot:XP_003065458.1 hypothetical protein CPC735_046830 [Coccidioides posadasii C735 delta SOWgp]
MMTPAAETLGVRHSADDPTGRQEMAACAGLTGRHVYLPTEIVHIIFTYIQELPDAPKILSSCCLVSRQWCSIATPLLYREPRIGHRNFAAFAAAFVSPNRPRSQKSDLGQYVRRLDLSELVHHSTVAVTAKLLQNVRPGLEVFIAPAYSLSSINLISISKCLNLQILDLSVVLVEFTLDEVKTATKNLANLKRLRLPRATSLTLSANEIPWPPNLLSLQFGGANPAEIDHFAEQFSWPESLTSLTLHGCKRLTPESIPAILGSPILQQNLRRLRVTTESNVMHFRFMADLVHFIPKVKFLSLPGSDINSTVIPEMETLNKKLDLEVIELGPSAVAWTFPINAFKRALKSSLVKLRYLRFQETHHASLMYDNCEEEVDNALMENARRAGYDQTKLETGEILTGCYVYS